MSLNPCPFCGKRVEIRGGGEEWIPTFNDPDSGGEPIYVTCGDSGMKFRTEAFNYNDYDLLAEEWNRVTDSLNILLDIK